MKRTLFILLIAICIGVTLYINKTKKLVPAGIKQQAESVLLADPLFPARPVWWQDDKILALGILPSNSESAQQTVANQAAIKACQLLLADKLPLNGLRIEIYDLLKIRDEDEWIRLGSAECN